MESYFFFLVLTVAVEIGVAAVFGYRNRVSQAAIVLVNLTTYPLLTLSSWLAFPPDPAWPTALGLLGVWETAFLEMLTVLLEWFLLLFVFRQGLMRLFVLSLCMNAASLMGAPVLMPLCGRLYYWLC
ncbi:MAG: hypothetical protein AB1646_13885 [Thermodesulfobacteriota bacterium]